MTKLLSNPEDFWKLIPNTQASAWPVVCVDFNGVIDSWNKPYDGTDKEYPPAPGATEFLITLKLHFPTVVIFTATIPLEKVERWFVRYQLDQYITLYSNHKVPAKVYIDDRAVTHKGDFRATLQQALDFKAFWE